MKKMGELAELKFCTKAFERGFDISSPYGDNTPYDLIVDTGKKLSRVQVKSTTRLDQSRRTDRYSINVTHGANMALRYKENEVDVMACHVFPMDIWYFIPLEVLRDAARVGLYPHRKAKHSFYEEYLENWGVFDN